MWSNSEKWFFEKDEIAGLMWLVSALRQCASSKCSFCGSVFNSKRHYCPGQTTLFTRFIPLYILLIYKNKNDSILLREIGKEALRLLSCETSYSENSLSLKESNRTACRQYPNLHLHACEGVRAGHARDEVERGGRSAGMIDR